MRRASRASRDDVPLTEYESALFAVMTIVLEQLKDCGPNWDELKRKLQEQRGDFADMGRRNASATIELLISAVFEPSYYVPSPPRDT